MPFYTRWKVDFLAACEYACLLVHLPRILMLCSHVYLHVPLACFRVFLSLRVIACFFICACYIRFSACGCYIPFPYTKISRTPAPSPEYNKR